MYINERGQFYQSAQQEPREIGMKLLVKIYFFYLSHGAC
jgi:hypothetical protein